MINISENNIFTSSKSKILFQKKSLITKIIFSKSFMMQTYQKFFFWITSGSKCSSLR